MGLVSMLLSRCVPVWTRMDGFFSSEKPSQVVRSLYRQETGSINFVEQLLGATL
jgi:hypothetical protein